MRIYGRTTEDKVGPEGVSYLVEMTYKELHTLELLCREDLSQGLVKLAEEAQAFGYFRSAVSMAHKVLNGNDSDKPSEPV